MRGQHRRGSIRPGLPDDVANDESAARRGPVYVADRLVFLDIDGVIAPYDAGDELDPGCIARLNRMVGEGRAEVVIISSWREVQPLAGIEAALRACGFTGKIAGATPVMASASRSTEVLAYLRSVPAHAGFVILDDALPYEASLASRAVRVAADVGLQDADVDEALRILGVPRNDPAPAKASRRRR